MKYQITHTTKFEYSDAVPVGHNIVHLEPRKLPYQSCDKFRLSIHPDPVEVTTGDDFFGNPCAYFSIEKPHQRLTIAASSMVDVAQRSDAMPDTPAWENIAGQLRAAREDGEMRNFQFTFASPLIKPFPELAAYARQSFTPGAPVADAAKDLTARINADFTFDPRATTVNTPLKEVFDKRHGVCQDFSHLQIACIRSLGLAARYVSGYLRTIPPPGKPRLVGADASHAWLAVYCGEAGWLDVDPTNNIPVSTDHVTVAWGRDYSEVCPVQGVIVGGGNHKMQVSVDVAPQP